jgi:hypothetical protein
MMVCERQGLAQQADWFPFADLSTANEKIKLLCILCASVVKNLNGYACYRGMKLRIYHFWMLKGKKTNNNEKKSADKASQKTWRIFIARRPAAYYLTERSI